MRINTMHWQWTRGVTVAALTMMLVMIGTSNAHAQLAPNLTYDGRVTVARIRYTPVPSPFACQDADSPAGNGWGHDYPMSVQGLLKAATELMTVTAAADSNLVLNVDDPEFMKHPFAMLTEPGCWEPTEKEIKALRAYLLKGGFLMVDDFTFYDCSEHHQELAIERFETWLKRLLPESRVVPLEASTPVLDGFFQVDPNGVKAFCSVPARLMGVYEKNDPTRRLLLVGNYIATIGHMWRFAGDDIGSGIDGGGSSYRLGLNYLLYGLSH